MQDKQDSLEALLRQTDSAAGTPSLPDDLVGRIRRRKRRQNQRRLALGGTLVVAVLLASGIGYLAPWRVRPNRKPETIAAQPSPSDPQELAALQAEIEMRSSLVEYMLALEAIQKHQAELRKLMARPSARELISREVEEVASITVYSADQQLTEPGGRESAIAAYRNVVRLFPQTRSAARAQERLENIKNLQGDAL